ncbi:hypothetical protein I1A_002233 [Pseudomonas fluorescens R124]|uniref:Uncharacterized protein n=1 Tax=Pseudomonas fluorescens R124 TaxID=743713 RepID=A0A7U9GS99_PSEFL|nr:hypothetical protein I1A_002233 [Pseudomonas fluorescens R124]
MQNSNKSEEQIFNLINKNRNQFEGTFSASVDGEEFMFADKNVLFIGQRKTISLLGLTMKTKTTLPSVFNST